MRGRIACFIPALEGGGAERVMLQLAGGFREHGHDVDLVVARNSGARRTEVPEGVRLVDLKAPKVLRALPGLTRYLRSTRPDALLAGLTNANLVALWSRALSMARVRTVISVHSHLSRSTAGTPTRSARLAHLGARVCYRWADGVVAVSDGVGRDVAQTARLDPKAVRVIYNPVPHGEIARQASEAVSHPWFQPTSPPVILAAGRLVAAKDYPTLIRAFADPAIRSRARLVILGEGPERTNLESLIRTLGLQGSVDLPGFVANPYAYMRRARLFALSSRWEGFALVVAEALAVGTPVVATNCDSGPAELLGHGRWGRLVPVGDPAAFAAEIRAALSESVSPEPLIQRAGDFAMAPVVRAYLSLLLPDTYPDA